jgi:hypothetical protein
MRSLLRIAGALWLCWPPLVLAASLKPHTLAERAAAANRVAVVSVLSRRSSADPADPRRIKTFTELLVAEDVKGHGPQRLSLVQLGGTVGPWSLRVPGDADLAPGEQALVFLNCPEPARCFLVALGEGKLPVIGAEVLVRDLLEGTTRRWRLNDFVAELKRLEAPRSSPTPSRAARASP